MRVVYETKCKTYRIVEHLDDAASIDDLKGDCFVPDVVHVRMQATILLDQLKAEERAFEQKVNDEGVFGYVLEQWDPSPGAGYAQLDSCWGFVGAYETEGDNAHYIVNEMREEIKHQKKQKGA